MPEEEFYGIVKMCDVFDLVWLDEQFTATAKDLLATHRLITVADLSRLGDGIPLAAIESKLRTDRQTQPLYLRDGRLIGCIHAAHDEDASLTANILLENLVCKASATMAFRTLLTQTGTDSQTMSDVLNSGRKR
jgi:betaine reductase